MRGRPLEDAVRNPVEEVEVADDAANLDPHIDLSELHPDVSPRQIAAMRVARAMVSGPIEPYPEPEIKEGTSVLSYLKANGLLSPDRNIDNSIRALDLEQTQGLLDHVAENTHDPTLAHMIAHEILAKKLAYQLTNTISDESAYEEIKKLKFKVAQEVMGEKQILEFQLADKVEFGELMGGGMTAMYLKPAKGSPEGSKPILLFHGTMTAAADKDPLNTLMADLNPRGVGLNALSPDRKSLQPRLWMFLNHINHDSGEKPTVIGHSLGGAIATLVGVYAPAFVDSVEAFGAPATNKDAEVAWNGIPPKLRPKVRQFSSNNDVIPMFGHRRIGISYVHNVSHGGTLGHHLGFDFASGRIDFVASSRMLAGHDLKEVLAQMELHGRALTQDFNNWRANPKNRGYYYSAAQRGGSTAAFGLVTAVGGTARGMARGIAATKNAAGRAWGSVVDWWGRGG